MMTFNYQEWKEKALSYIRKEFPEHMHNDFYHGPDGDIGFVYWPTRENVGFFSADLLLKIGHTLNYINEDIEEDYDRHCSTWIEKHTDDEGFPIEVVEDV